MIQRYSRPAMREIWSEQRKLEIWLQIELLAVRRCAKRDDPEAGFRPDEGQGGFQH
jgi:adenylosuccinate lyase